MYSSASDVTQRRRWISQIPFATYPKWEMISDGGAASREEEVNMKKRAPGEEAPQNVMAQFTRSLRKRRSFFFQKARLSCATTCPGDKNRHSQEFMSRTAHDERASNMGNARSRHQEELISAGSFGNAVREHFSFGWGCSATPTRSMLSGGEGKKIMRLINGRGCRSPHDMSCRIWAKKCSPSRLNVPPTDVSQHPLNLSKKHLIWFLSALRAVKHIFFFIRPWILNMLPFEMRYRDTSKIRSKVRFYFTKLRMKSLSGFQGCPRTRTRLYVKN